MCSINVNTEIVDASFVQNTQINHSLHVTNCMEKVLRMVRLYHRSIQHSSTLESQASCCSKAIQTGRRFSVFFFLTYAFSMA